MSYVHRFHTVFTPEQWERLGALSRRLELPRGAVVRLALLRLADQEGVAAAESALAGRIEPAMANPTRASQAAMRTRLEQEPTSRFVELESE